MCRSLYLVPVASKASLMCCSQNGELLPYFFFPFVQNMSLVISISLCKIKFEAKKFVSLHSANGVFTNNGIVHKHSLS